VAKKRKILATFQKSISAAVGFIWKSVDYVDKPTFLKGSSFENA
jgi:hypothetical protein